MPLHGSSLNAVRKLFALNAAALFTHNPKKCALAVGKVLPYSKKIRKYWRFSKKMKATIQNAKLMRIDKVWKGHKPQGLGFSDTDVVIIDLKTNEGNVFTQSFYCRLKGDDTIWHSITKPSEKRQGNIMEFIRKYIGKDEKYKVRTNIQKWKGK